MLPLWRTKRELSEDAEETSMRNKHLRRLVHQQKAIIQQLQIRKDLLLQKTSQGQGGYQLGTCEGNSHNLQKDFEILILQ